MNEVQRKKELYDELLIQKEQGKVFTKEDLTYNILYKLSVIENVPDSLIGNIFGLKKYQVNYQKRKQGIENIYLKKLVDHPEIFEGYLEEHAYDANILESEYFYDAIKSYAKLKGWNPNLVDKYLKEKMTKSQSETSNDIDDIEFNMEIEYKVEITDSIIEQSNSHTNTRQSNGKKSNQMKTNASKIEAGKLGEKIVLDEELKKIKELKKKKIVPSDAKAKSVTETKK